MKLNFHYSAPLEICFFMVSFFAKVINVSDSGQKVRRLSIKCFHNLLTGGMS